MNEITDDLHLATDKLERLYGKDADKRKKAFNDADKATGSEKEKETMSLDRA